MMYLASVFIINFSKEFKSPEILCPENPQAAQSTTSWFGSCCMIDLLIN